MLAPRGVRHWGYTAPAGAREHFGALLVGYYDADGRLIYAGRVGTGFDSRTLEALHAKFTKLVQDKSPFQKVPRDIIRKATWLKPRLVTQVQFTNWTENQQLRQPSFQGLRQDKAAKDVVRE
jgi:bifunctional non-homologous end joining protein LigD